MSSDTWPRGLSVCSSVGKVKKKIGKESFIFLSLIFYPTDGPSLSYGPYYFCELLGSGHALCFLLVIITVILNLRQIKEVLKASNQTVLKSWKCLKVSQMTVALQWINFLVILILSVILTVGFRASCDAFRVFVEEKIDKKLNVDLTRLRGETIDERFVDDPFFWRYTRRVTNSFGAEMFSTVTSCRLMMTDPEIATLLHENHVDKFAGKRDKVRIPLSNIQLFLFLSRLLRLLVWRGRISSRSILRGHEDQQPDGGQPRGLVAGDCNLDWSRDLHYYCEKKDGEQQQWVLIQCCFSPTSHLVMSNAGGNLDKSLLTPSPTSKSTGVLSRKSNLGSSRASSVRDIDSLVLDSLVLASGKYQSCQS